MGGLLQTGRVHVVRCGPLPRVQESDVHGVHVGEPARHVPELRIRGRRSMSETGEAEIKAMPELNKIYQGDCLEIMRGWPEIR